MDHLKPIDLLKVNLLEYEKALHKSFEAYQLKKITDITFSIYKRNLEPLIFEFKQAIQMLETWNNNK